MRKWCQSPQLACGDPRGKRRAGRLPRTGTQSRDSVAGPTPSIVLLRRASLPLHNRTPWRRHHEGEDLRGHPGLRILGCGMEREAAGAVIHLDDSESLAWDIGQLLAV